MSKILCLADSGFGKTAGIGAEPRLGIEGLPVKETFIISVTSKPLTFVGSAAQYKITTPGNLKGGRRIITNVAKEISTTITELAKFPMFKYIVWDDANYVMQDHFMKKALASGWDTPKQIGYNMSLIFDAMEKFTEPDRHIIVLAHGEDAARLDGRQKVKMKTTGKMVAEFITPEGKFDVVLVGNSRWDAALKKSVREYVTNENEFITGAKSPYGMFPEIIGNDLGKIVRLINEFYSEKVGDTK